MEVEIAKGPVASPAGGANAPDGAMRARRLLAAGALVVTCGVGLVGTAHPDLGGPVLMAGWLLLAAGIHRFGRGA